MSFGLVIGGGPAGLMAADVMAQAGLGVIVAEQMPTLGRKFLMAGKSGLNLTKNEPAEAFIARMGDDFRDCFSSFPPSSVLEWAEGLGQPVFTGSSGRVFPKAMKASPLLRAWLARLNGLGVDFRTRWRWTGWRGNGAAFETPEGPKVLKPDALVLAMGGASWRRLGSDGGWAKLLGVSIAPFKPANFGLVVEWSDHMRPFFGAPLKPLVLKAGGKSVRAECVISERGLEGGGIYAVSAEVRDGAPLSIDLVPDLSHETIVDRWSAKAKKMTVSRVLKSAFRLSPAKVALLNEMAKGQPHSRLEYARLLKDLPIRHSGPRPIDEAISTAGGIRRKDLDETLMLKSRPGVFAAGEMLDWEAPTGGYLITGCLATGRHAGAAAAAWALK